MSLLRQINKPSTSLRRRLLSPQNVISFAIAGVFLIFLVTRFDIDLADTWTQFKDSNLLLFALAVLVHYTTFIFRGARWRILLRNAQKDQGTPTPSTIYCGSMILLGWFINSIAGFRLGDAYRPYAYSEDTKASFPRTVGTILAERVLDTALVLLLLVTATVVLLATGVGTSWVFVAIAAAMMLVLAAVLIAMKVLRSRVPKFIPKKLHEAYHRFHEGTVGSFGQLPLVTVLGLLGWLAEVARLFLVAEALGFDLEVSLVIFVTLASAMLTLVPFTPGGLGAVELGVTGLLTLSSKISDETVAFPIVALDRSISWLSIIVVGAVVFLARELTKGKHRQEKSTEEALPSGGR